MRAVARRRLLDVLAIVVAATVFAFAVVPAGHAPPTGYPALAEPALPLDDAYIFLRFAQQIARGNGLEWSDGVGSSGATSLALLPLLVPGQVSDRLATQVRWSQAVGWGTLVLLGLAALRLLRSAGLEQPAPLVGSLAVVFSGPVGWGAVAGMESALNAAAVLLAAALWIGVLTGDRVDRRSLLWAAVVTGLLPLVRPENLLLSGLGCLAVLFSAAFRGRRVLAGLTLLPGALLALLNLVLTGDPKPAGALAKSITEFAYLDPATIWALYDLNLGERLLPAYLGQRGALLWAPVGWIALATAVALPLLVLRERRRFRALAVVGVVWWVLFLAAPLSSMVEWQNMRHHHAGLATAWMLAFVAVGEGLEWLRSRSKWTAHARWGFCIVPLLLLLALPGWRADYRLQVENLLLRHGPAAEWLAANAEGRILLINDAGYLAVRHDTAMIDAIGLGTPVLARPYRHGPGATVEALARLDRRAELAAVNLDVFHLGPILGEPLGPDPARQADTLVAAVRGDRLASTALHSAGIDFADLDSEGSFDLDWSPAPHPLEPSRIVLVEEKGTITAQGCRPLRERLSVHPPDETGRASLLVVAPPAAAAELVITDSKPGLRGQAIVPAGDWRRIDFDYSGRVEIRRVSPDPPCLESLAFGS